MVVVDGVEPGGGPERKRYAITDDGVTDVERWLGKPERPDLYLQNTLYTKVVLALLTGRSAVDILDAQRSEHLTAMRELTRRKASGDLAEQLICDHALFHLEADLRWLELTAARLDGLAREVRVVTPLASEPQIEPAGAGTAAPLLAAVDLVKSFGATPALQGASLELAAGEIVAVMGPSGSGKSTLLHCLAGIVQPDGGRVEYGGRDLGGLSDRARSALRRSDFGFVFQFGQLVPELTCLENVALPLRLAGLRRGAAEERARGWLERLEVADVAGQRQGDVSGGQAQRVAVARALVTDPRVIFADEPTGALDSLNGERVLLELTAAARAAAVAIVLVTHEPRVAAYADREVVVRDGRTRSVGAA